MKRHPSRGNVCVFSIQQAVMMLLIFICAHFISIVIVPTFNMSFLLSHSHFRKYTFGKFCCCEMQWHFNTLHVLYTLYNWQTRQEHLKSCDKAFIQEKSWTKSSEVKLKMCQMHWYNARLIFQYRVNIPGCEAVYRSSWRKGMELTFLWSLAGYRNSTAVNRPELLLSWYSRGVKLNRPGSEVQAKADYSISSKHWINRNSNTPLPTLQHTVIRLPVPPPERLPECCRLRPLITFPNSDIAAAVEACF